MSTWQPSMDVGQLARVLGWGMALPACRKMLQLWGLGGHATLAVPSWPTYTPCGRAAFHLLGLLPALPAFGAATTL